MLCEIVRFHDIRLRRGKIMKHVVFVIAVLATSFLACPARSADFAARVLPPATRPGEDVSPFVSVPAGLIALTHVRVIDGTGAAALGDRTLIIEDGKIAAIRSGAAAIPKGAHVLDLSGRSVLPGLVGMHDHLFYIARPNLTSDGDWQPPLIVPEMVYSAPRLYLAGGVTTLRTTGSVEPYTDLNLKAQIDAGTLPGPHIDATAPYLEGKSDLFIQMHQLTGPDEARQMVDYWAAQGMTSFKAYMHITRDELGAAITEAHKLGLKVTGHLCAVTYREAIDLGIDNLEHGFFVNTEDDPGKQPDQCTPGDGAETLAKMTAGSAEAKQLIDDLITHHVAITSTLPVMEVTPDGRPALPARFRAVMSPESVADYDKVVAYSPKAPAAKRAARYAAYRNGMALEREFVAAGGLLLAGPDPTGAGNVVPGYSDQREIELLVDAGFTPLQAIRIGTLNGAIYEGLDSRIGSIAIGKDADLIVVEGDPSRRVTDIENIEYIFKDGVGYDPKKIVGSVTGDYGRY
jgi:imidazolonepropionase-like amidohydrolase